MVLNRQICIENVTRYYSIYIVDNQRNDVIISSGNEARHLCKGKRYISEESSKIDSAYCHVA